MKIFGAVCFWLSVAVAVIGLGFGVVEIVKFLWVADPRLTAALLGIIVVAFGTTYHINQDD